MGHNSSVREASKTLRTSHILVSESGEDLDLPQGSLAVGLVLKRTDLLDGHFGYRVVVKC